MNKSCKNCVDRGNPLNELFICKTCGSSIAQELNDLDLIIPRIKRLAEELDKVNMEIKRIVGRQKKDKFMGEKQK